MSVDELARFDWVRKSAIGAAGCIAVVERAELAVVASAFGGDLAHADEAELVDAFGERPYLVDRVDPTRLPEPAPA